MLLRQSLAVGFWLSNQLIRRDDYVVNTNFFVFVVALQPVGKLDRPRL